VLLYIRELHIRYEFSIEVMSQKENLGANSKEQGSDPIDLRKATTIPNAAASAHPFNSPTPNFIDRSYSPVTSLSTNFASQVQVSVSAPCTARRSLNPQFDLSEPSTPETTPRFEQSIMFRFESSSDPVLRRSGLPQNIKSRSCSDVGALFMSDEASIYSPSSSMDSLSGYSSESSALSSSSSSKIAPPSAHPLSVSGTLPVDFNLALPIIKGLKANLNSISCETVRLLLLLLHFLSSKKKLRRSCLGISLYRVCKSAHLLFGLNRAY
jgi:hypothetical protein